MPALSATREKMKRAKLGKIETTIRRKPRRQEAGSAASLASIHQNHMDSARGEHFSTMSGGVHGTSNSKEHYVTASEYKIQNFDKN